LSPICYTTACNYHYTRQFIINSLSLFSFPQSPTPNHGHLKCSCYQWQAQSDRSEQEKGTAVTIHTQQTCTTSSGNIAFRSQQCILKSVQSLYSEPRSYF